MSTMSASIPLAKGDAFMGNIAQFQTDPLKFFADSRQEYGDVLSFRLGPLKMFTLSRPDYVHQVLVEQAEKFYKGDALKKAMGSFFGNGIVFSEGDFWRQQRKLILPAFHHKQIASYADVMVKFTQAMLDTWKSGETRQIDQEMHRLTFSIVAKTIFDLDTNAVSERIGESMMILQSYITPRLNSFILLPEWVPTTGNRKLKHAAQQLDAALAETIREHRASKDKGDLLSMLLLAQDEDKGGQMTDKQVHDEVITMFVAGHETTATVMSWVWYLLSGHPEVEAKLADELNALPNKGAITLQDLAQLPYNEMVIKEVLRLYPVAWVLTRFAVDDVQIDNFTLKKGSVVFICPYVIHRDERYFDAPDEFRPERFRPELDEQRPRSAYLPFGNGPRICIGNSFATMEARLILATVMQRYRLRVPADRKVVHDAALTLRPKGGLPMQIQQLG